MSTFYCDDKSIQILISLLKQNNIKKIIASPGTTNLGFVVSVKRDPFFEVYSCVDERAACYMAGGLAVESKEPVVITCTGATASRNYYPGLTEAFYRKIPILAITFAPHFGNIGRNVPQAIDRRAHANDVVVESVQIPNASTKDDEFAINLLINKALIKLKDNQGPVHINIVYDNESLSNFTTKEVPKARLIKKYTYQDELPELDLKKRIGIFIGSHRIIEKKLESLIEKFCETYNAVVLHDHTSNYKGKYGILPNLILDQDSYTTPLNNFDILIYIGEVSGAYLNIKSRETWRVCDDGELKDVYKNMTKLFAMDESYFFEKIIKSNGNNTSLYEQWNLERNELLHLINDDLIPFSNVYIAKITSSLLPRNSVVHLGILNSLRSWNFFDVDSSISFSSNTGGFGIDGFTSTLIGASLFNKEKIYFGFVGDLAFFYDMNSLGNINVSNNVRIMLINNGGGTEFHNYSHVASVLEEDVSKYVAADGHFGNKSNTLVKNLANDFGFEYLKADNKEEFLSQIDYFVSKEHYSKPIIFEVFTNSNDESAALKYIRSQKKDTVTEMKNVIKKALPKKTKTFLKKVMNKG